MAVVEPTDPDVRHVRVRGHGEHAPTQPGLVDAGAASPAMSSERLDLAGGPDHLAEVQSRTREVVSAALA